MTGCSGSQRRRRQAIVATRLTAAEMEVVQRSAAACGRSVADWTRGLILAACMPAPGVMQTDTGAISETIAETG